MASSLDGVQLEKASFKQAHACFRVLIRFIGKPKSINSERTPNRRFMWRLVETG